MIGCFFTQGNEAFRKIRRKKQFPMQQKKKNLSIYNRENNLT